jgi:hypothetical protein
MKRSRAVIAGALPLLMATAAYADTPAGPPVTGTLQAPATLPAPVAPESAQPQPFWTLGGVPVRIWAPVAPPYDAAANRTGAGDPLWDTPE